MLICLISTGTLLKLLFCIKLLDTRYIETLLLQFAILQICVTVLQCVDVYVCFQSLGDDSFTTDSSISADEARIDLQWKQVLDWFKSIVLGQVHVVTRKVNITHILGSVTVSTYIDSTSII